MLGTLVRVRGRSGTAPDTVGEADGIQARIKQIKAQIEETSSDYDREKLQERVAKLAGGVAVIKVGAATEVEMKEKKERRAISRMTEFGGSATASLCFICRGSSRLISKKLVQHQVESQLAWIWLRNAVPGEKPVL